MDKSVYKLLEEVAKSPTFSGREKNIHDLIHKCLNDSEIIYQSFIPNELNQDDESLIITVKGKGDLIMNPPIALCAHLDKIDHKVLNKLVLRYDDGDLGFLTEDIETTKELLDYEETKDEVVGVLDDSVGITLCLAILKDIISKNDYPPIYLLLSSREEMGMLGSRNISEYLISHIDEFLTPSLFLTIDCCPRCHDDRGIALYRNNYDPDNMIVDWFMSHVDDLYVGDGMSDYLVYADYFTEEYDSTSIAVEPAVRNMHSVGERMYKEDFENAYETINNFLNYYMTNYDQKFINDKILSCPFCGHRPVFGEDRGSGGFIPTISCGNNECHAILEMRGHLNDRRGLIKKWNRRF